MTAVAWQHSISMTHRTDFAVIPYVSSMLPNNEIQKRDSRIFYVWAGNHPLCHCKHCGFQWHYRYIDQPFIEKWQRCTVVQLTLLTPIPLRSESCVRIRERACTTWQWRAKGATAFSHVIGRLRQIRRTGIGNRWTVLRRDGTVATEGNLATLSEKSSIFGRGQIFLGATTGNLLPAEKAAFLTRQPEAIRRIVSISLPVDKFMTLFMTLME